MPSSSAAQRRLMQAAANNPTFAKEAGIPVDVAKEFDHADHMRDLKKQARSEPPMRKRIPR